MNDEKAHVNH